MRALLVDDDLDFVVLASYVLENLGGFQVTHSEGGYGVVDLARREQPDVILLDWVMPAPDGPELARLLAADPDTRDIPLIFFTGRDETHTFQLEGLGAKGVIFKPFEPELLAAQIKQLMAADQVISVASTLERRGDRDHHDEEQDEPPGDVEVE